MPLPKHPSTTSESSSASQGNVASSKLPSWSEISHLSDQELIDLFDASENQLSRPSALRRTSVRRIASDVVMKIGPFQDSEPYTQSLVRQSTTIPVPTVRRYFRCPARGGVLIMDYVAGQTLEACWSSLSFWRRICVFWSLRSYIKQLRTVLVPGTSRSEQFPGPIGDSPQMCWGPLFTEIGAGPFASYAELNAWFEHKLEVNRRIMKTPAENVSFDSSAPLVLTHHDLYPNNIIIDEHSRIWIIDWEDAGFYPQWLEYTVMQCGWDILGKWKREVLGFVAGFYWSQASFIASIGWAIDSGYIW